MAKDRSKNPDEQGGGEEYLNKEETKRVEIEQKKASILMELKEAQDGLVSRKAELFLRGKGAEEMANSFGKLLNEVEFLQTDITNLDLSLKASAVEKKLKVIKKQVSRWSDKVEQAFADYDELMKDLASSEVPSPEAETPDVEPKASPDISYGSGFLNFNKTILNFNPLLEKDTCDIFFENGVVMLAGKGKFANLFAEVNLGDDKKSLRVKIMRGPDVEYEQPAESAVSAKIILENYFTKKPDAPDTAATKKSTIVLPEADEPPAVDEADEKKAILSHAKTVLASPEEEPASKEIAGKFVLEDNIAKIGDVAIDLRPLVDSGNYEVSISEKGTVEIFDLNDENHRARFQFDKDEKKIAFQKMVKGRKSATVMLADEAVLPQLQYLFPELRPVVRPPFKFEGGVLTAEDFSWDLNSLLDSEKCDVSLADNVVTFQGKGELAKIKIQMKIDKNNDEVRLKKGDDVKRFKVENAKNYLERTFAKEEKKVEPKKSEPQKVEPVAKPIESVEKEREESAGFLAGIISEEKLKKLKDILDKAVIEQNKFAKMATTAAIGLPRVEAGSKDYERKKRELKDKPEEFEKYEKSLEEIEIKRGVFTKEEYADFVKDVEKTLVDTYWRWHGMPRHEKDKTREKQDKWFNSVKEYLNIKPPEEQKFGDEAMSIYRELRGAFEDEFKSISKSKAELFEIKIAKPELYNSYLSKIDALNEKTYSISEELESIEGDESLKEKANDFRLRIKEIKDELRAIMVAFDHEQISAAVEPVVAAPEIVVAETATTESAETINVAEPTAIDIDTSEFETPAATPTPESAPPAKKSIWQKAKEKIGLVKESVFNKTAGKAAAEMAYKTATSIFGVKTITDIVGALVSDEYGWGDIHKRRVSSREMKAEKSAIRTSMEEVFKGGEKVNEKIADLKLKIENSKHISAKDREVLLENLQRIASEYESAENKATEERDKKVSALLKIYMKNKVSAMTLAKDALNTALTLSGMAMVRGAAYAALSVGERMVKANAEFEKSKVGLAPNVRRSRTKFLLKDLIVGAAVETGRSLVFMGAKKETKGAGRVVDFVKAVGTLARGFGIYGLALTDSMNPEEAMQAFIEKVQEQGINCTVKDNFINNAERVIQLYTHPIDTISGQSVEQAPVAAKGAPHEAEAVSAAAAVPVAEQISPELKSYLDQFGDSPSAREAFLAEVNNGHSPEEVVDAFVVHKGDGLERIIQRQLLLDPEKYGMHDQNILHDAAKLRQWAGHEASVIAVKNHLDDKYLIFNAKHPQHLVVNADGKIDLSGAGKLHHQSEIDAARARRGAVLEERAPERPVPAYEESGEEKFMTDVEKAQVDELWDSGRQADAMNMMMQYRELGPVYVLPSGFETHDHFGDLAGEAAGGQTAVVPRESAEQLAQELKTPEILGEKTVGESMAPISAPDSATGTKLQQMLETAEKHAGDEPPVVFHGDYGKPEFEYDKTGKVVGVDVNPDPNLTFGKAGKEVLSDRAGVISTSGAAKKVIELGAADDEYKELMNKGSQNSDEANFLKGVVAKKMTDLSKNTSKPLGQLFKSDVLYRYDFKAEAGLAAQLETADKYKG
jgi:hypothetical protein